VAWAIAPLFINILLGYNTHLYILSFAGADAASILYQQSFIHIDNIYKPALTQATFTLQDNACECSKELWNLVCGS
jgi:hypothetical protein